MKFTKSLSMFVFALFLIMHCCSSGAEASRWLLEKAHAIPNSTSSSSQSLKGLQASKKNPFKKVDSNLGRKIPPRRANPTHNKCKPPYSMTRS
ncbi:hypothetical protein Leryth_012131 [Lithospermum erythrorhizon]|nr:hypothetical protein Leryth_012131 [Lithospermum erythrorhizon]